jgi:probable O-glycosylation ligase (exosortase A-associated)
VILRDIVLTGLILWLLPFCLMRPWIGILVWSWIGYMNPHRLTWGFAYTMPFGLMAMLATLVGVVFTSEKKSLPRTIEVYLLGALWLWFFVTTTFAFYPDQASTHFMKVSKILFGIFLSMVLLQDPRKVRALVWVIALSIGFYGFKGGVWAILTGGGNRVLGPPDSFIEGNTEIGLALNMVIPLLVFLQRQESRRWARHLLRAGVFLCIVASLVTYSRGALLGLAIVVPLIFLQSRWRLVLLPLLAVGIWILPSIMPAQWNSRMETIEGYQEDISANQRLNSWYVAWELGKAYPIMGGGFRTFTKDVYEAYMAEYAYAGAEHDAHSIYFQVLGEHGFVGLGLFIALLASTLISLRRLAGKTRHDPSRQWIGDLAKMVEISVFGYVVSGTFLSMSYFDLFYHLVAITAILKALVAEPVTVSSAAPTAVPSLPVPVVGGRRPMLGT